MSPEKLATIRARTIDNQDRWNIILAQQDIKDLLEYVEELQNRVSDLTGAKNQRKGVDLPDEVSRVGT